MTLFPTLFSCGKDQCTPLPYQCDSSSKKDPTGTSCTSNSECVLALCTEEPVEKDTFHLKELYNVQLSWELPVGSPTPFLLTS